jgi:2',3'-cyclic-nucleotide 2'-phosphodiesterase (5'-nucleotidase family)
MRFNGFVLFSILILSSIVWSCKTVDTTKKDYELAKYELQLYNMNQSTGIDSTIWRIIKPYQDSLNKTMNIKVGLAKTDLTRSKPESSLGNIIAESLRERASLLLRTNVDIGLLNLGGLRTDIGSGEITIGLVYELMPFENKLSILYVTGTELKTILDEIAVIGGEPISGVRFRIVNNKAEDIVVSGQPIGYDKMYTIATNDYLVNGGGFIPELWKIQKKDETNLLIRDIILEYVKNRKVLEARLDGRVRF